MEQRLLHLLNHPFSVAPSDLFLIEDAIEKYPYFQPLHLIRQKAIGNTNDESYRDHLQKTAVFCSNRKILFQYLHAEVAENQQKNDREEISKIPEPQTSCSKESFEENSIEDVPPTPIGDEESALNTSEPALTEEVHSESKSVVTHEEQVEQEYTSENYQPHFHSFNDWLKINKEKTEHVNPEKTESTDNQNSVNEKFRVIEEFLDKNPKITPAKEYRPSIEISTPHQETMSHLMTETLAGIYVEQNKYDKAIKAYTILRLKYPEKSGYFADRINEIKILKNNKQ